MTRPWRALALDDDPRWRDLLSETLAEAGFLVDVAPDPSTARSLLARGFYHLLVVDLNLDSGDAETFEGMSFLQELHDEGHGDAELVVVLTQYPNEERMRATFRDYQVKDFLSKRTFDNFRFVDYLRRLLASDALLNPDLELLWDGLEGAPALAAGLALAQGRVKPGSPLQQELGAEIEDLFCRLFHDAQKLVIHPMRQGNSGACVVRVEPFYRVGGGRPLVVKLGPVDAIWSEAQNFRELVEPFLGGGRATSLRSMRRTSRLGGIVYSLLGVTNDRFEDFASFYRRSGAEPVRQVIDNLFGDTCRAWYANSGNPVPCDLTADYQSLLGFTAEGLRQAFENGLKAVQGKEKVTFGALSDRRPRPNPLRLLAAPPLLCSTYVSTTHGDLNESNVLVDSRGATWLIDFLRTGAGHVLRDYAGLDASIRFHLLTKEEATLDQRLALETALLARVDAEGREVGVPPSLAGNAALEKAYEACGHLRDLAAAQVRRNPGGDMKELDVACLYFALNTIRFLALETVQREHAFLSASLLAERLGL